MVTKETIVPIVTIEVYRTTVVNGVATASEPFTLEINDADGSGSITRDEWVAYTNDSAGHIGGSVGGVPALWDGTNGTLNTRSNGYLYTAEPIPTTSPENETAVQDILNDIVHAPKYDVLLADLEICFLSGTMIETPTGPRAVETLRSGDLVMTRDHGAQPLVWSSSSHVSREDLDRSPNKRPIQIAAGALGDGLPHRMVEVSPQHRVLVRHEGGEYLISARHLLKAGVPGVSARRDDSEFTLIHIACADHQIVLAEGAAMETFFTGPMAVRALGLPQKLSLMIAFPELAMGHNPMTPARPFIKHQDYVRMLHASTAA